MLIDTLHDILKLNSDIMLKYQYADNLKDMETFLLARSNVKYFKSWIKEQIVFNSYYEKKYTSVVSYEKTFDELL
jgi:hypothetical protein